MLTFPFKDKWMHDHFSCNFIAKIEKKNELDMYVFYLG